MDLIKKPLHQRFSKKKQFLFFAIPLILATLFQWLFWGHVPGVNYPLFILSLFIGYLSLFWDRLNKKSIAGWTTMVSAIILSFVYLFWTATPIIVINFLFIPILALTSAFLLTRWNEYDWANIAFALEFFPKAVAKLLENIPTPISSLFHLFKGRKESSVRKQIITGIIVALPLLMLIIALLSSADAVFENYLSTITNHFTINIADEVAGRILLALFTFWGLASFAWMIASYEHKEPVKEMECKRSLSSITAITIISLVVLLYLIFLGIQFKYLFLGADLSFLENMTYAEYARRGFGELVTVTIINLSLILGVSVFTKDESTLLTTTRKSLSAIVVLFTTILLYSSHLRLGLYEQAYGFTYTRVLVHCFIFFLAFALIASLIKIVKEDFPFIKTALTLGLGSWLIISFMNIDKLIVEKNIERFYENGRLDTHYLVYNLSNDALPHLARFAVNEPTYTITPRKQTISSSSDEIRFYTQISFCSIANECYNLESFYDLEEFIQPWQEFNLSKKWKARFMSHQIAESKKE